MTKYIPIRKFGLYSLYVRLPAEFVRANGLSPGDLVLLDLDALKIVKREVLDAIQQEQQANLESIAVPVREEAVAEPAE
jgi:antitoxin component of MazEF toxin-antitoxin module